MRIRISRSVVPNLFTVLNIFFGFLCIISAVDHRFTLAAWYIFFAAVCDLLDGFMARLTHSTSEFGVQLDSLADVVSFGVAPSVVLYLLTLYTFNPFGMLIAAFQLIFGALRLARFNVQLVGFVKDHFVGLSIPVSALTLMSFILFFGPEAIQTNPTLQYVLLALTICNGLLMVSTIRYPVFPKISLRAFRTNPWEMGALVLFAIVAVVLRERGIFPILLFIEAFGILAALIRVIRRTPEEVEDVDAVDSEAIHLDSHP